MSQGAEHDKLKRDILITLGCRPDVLVENSPTGKFRHIYRKEVIAIGASGRPDITGTRKLPIVTGNGVQYTGQSFAVEVKTGSAKLSTQQKRWRDRFESLGGLYVLARSVEDVQDAFQLEDQHGRETED